MRYQFWFEAVAALFKREQQAPAKPAPAEAPKEPKLCLVLDRNTLGWTAEICPAALIDLEVYRDADSILHFRIVENPEVGLKVYPNLSGLPNNRGFLDVRVTSEHGLGSRGFLFLQLHELWALPIPHVGTWKKFQEFKEQIEELEAKKAEAMPKLLLTLTTEKTKALEIAGKLLAISEDVISASEDYQRVRDHYANLDVLAKARFEELHPAWAPRMVKLLQARQRLEASGHFLLQFELEKPE